jgi:hypothetical protein
MRRILILLFINFLLSLKIYCQVGGNFTYAFLNLPNSARVASLGGKSIAIRNDDLNMPFHNPSLLNPSMDRHIVLNYVNYFAGVNYGYVSYAKDYYEKGMFAAGIHYVNYGEFIEADILGNRTGTFSASEYAFNLIYAKKIDSLISFGVTLKPVYSHLERYNSIGILADAGLSYFNPEKQFTAALVIRNAGFQLYHYYRGNRERMPFEIQAGVSQKLLYAPFRFSLLLQHLEKADMTYQSDIDKNTTYNPLGGEVGKNNIEILGDQLMRHAIFGIEFLPGENFYVNLGYNYQRRQELKIPGKPGMVGFSWGFGMKISKFHISYGRATYHVAGASDHFSLSVNLSELYRHK